MSYILAFDQGTTSSRAILFNPQGEMVSVGQKEFEQIYPKPGWVEHNAEEIWATQIGVATEAVSKAGISKSEIAAIGITNQRETVVIWDKKTGKPICNAICWQDRRTSSMIDQLKQDQKDRMIQQKTGLVADAYFSASKISWILQHVEGARQKAEAGELAFGTIDSWLIYKLTEGTKHITDFTNASRTMIYNIHTCEWDQELLELFQIPSSILPEVHSSSEVYGEVGSSIFCSGVPISGIAGDQEAALFGQLCTEKGMVKNTYGTGCFTLMNTGSQAVESNNRLLTTSAWQRGNEINYALEGSVFIAGAAVQWLRDGLKIIRSAPEIEGLANSVDDNGGVYFVPAFTGLGAPQWDQYARGTIVGITRGTTSAHIARATLEAIAFQVADLLDAMNNDSGLQIPEMRVDGGASANNTLMQMQSDILQIPVVRPTVTETTALGAAYLAGLAVGVWKSTDDLNQNWKVDARFEPSIQANEISEKRKRWSEAVQRSLQWETKT